MQFVYPLFLGALALLTIPILIHLFYFRRYKKVLFSNVRFIRELKEESSIRSRLKNLLILFCRLAAFALLVLGFAQPFLQKDGEVKKGRKSVSMFIDNSYSMASLSQDAPLLDEAKLRASEIIAAYEADDEFQVITHDLQAGQQRWIQKDQALGLIEDIELTAEVHLLSTIQERQKQMLEQSENPNKLIYYLTDFQQNITDLDLGDTLYEYNLVQLQAVIEKNVSIDSAWFEAPIQMINQPNRLFVKLRNWSGDQAENLQLSIRRDGAVKPLSSVDIPANASRIDTVMINVLSPGIQTAELRITDFPITFDDRYFITFSVREEVNTLAISDGSPSIYLDAALSGGSIFSHRAVDSRNIDYATINAYQLIVLADLANISTGLSSALQNYLNQGGNVLFFPSQRADISSFNAFLQAVNAGQLSDWDTIPKQVSTVNQSAFVFADVFETTRGNLRLPSTKRNFKLSGRGSGYISLMTYRNGQSYLSEFKVGSGSLYLCAAPLDEQVNSLVLQAEVFVPMLYKMGLATSRRQEIAYTIGQDNIIEIDNLASNVDAIYKLRGSETFIPGQQSYGKRVVLNLYNQIEEDGFYHLYLDEGETLATYAFNANRLESNPTCVSPNELTDRYGDHANIVTRTQLANVGQYITEKDRGVPLWKYCLMLALLFLALEAIIIRFYPTIQSRT